MDFDAPFWTKMENKPMASGSRVQRSALPRVSRVSAWSLVRSYGEADGFRAGDVGTVLWTDDAIHLEMDAGPMLTIADADGVRRLGPRDRHLPGAA